jgi:hypothetical protein
MSPPLYLYHPQILEQQKEEREALTEGGTKLRCTVEKQLVEETEGIAEHWMLREAP